MGVRCGGPAANLPRTVLSAANAAESPTAVVARREMESWRMLQLEPSALRRPDEFASPTQLGADGSHLAATLYRLARGAGGNGDGSARETRTVQTYARIANRLSGLIDDVREVRIDRDEKRELLTLYVKNAEGTRHPARALSDGTLRFLALAVVEMDPDMQGVICLEEPENGVHPARVPAILKLLSDIAMDTTEAVGPDNPLRQAIVNTHSPAVFQEVPEDSVVFIKTRENMGEQESPFMEAHAYCLADTWRDKGDGGPDHIPRGDLLAYLNPVLRNDPPQPRNRRVIDRDDMQELLPPSAVRP